MSRPAKKEKWGTVALSREETHERKKRQLVAAAGMVFRARGFQDASMDDIAAYLNVSKTALYYYVKNKGELLFLCHSLAFELGDEALREARASGRTGAEKLKILIRSYVTALTSELGGGALMTSDNALEPAHLDEIKKRRRAWDDAFRQIVTEGLNEGSIRPCDPKLVEFFVMGAIRGMHRWFAPDGPKTGEEIADELIAMVFDGIGQKPKE